jgi:hypothetical protein
LDGDDAEEDYHLHIVASDQSSDGLVIVVSVSTLYRFADKTVVLKAGEHARVTHESFIAYNFAKAQKVSEIEARLAKLPNLVREPCTPELLKKVQAGILESEQTENGVRHLFRELYP